ncbi:MAG TPA: glycoside hydrolase family 3 C-terminal domain-containing protein [Chthoniobacterales bacterium]
MKTSLLSRLAVSGLFVCLLSAHAQQSSSTASSKLSPSSVSSRVNQILKEFTVDDAISYIGGTGFFDFKPIPVNDFSPLNPQLYQTDGPLGVRRNEPSIRFPSGLTLAATWNPDRAHDQGVSMGRDARARGYFSILGPGMDFYRVPMGGRNFEYMTGEDPFLGSQLNPSEIQGIQAQGVWACAKHYVCNDEEENRTNVHIIVDERTLREIYLPPFEAAVKVGKVATVMGSYNAVDSAGTDAFACENPFLLTTILRTEWGFHGILMSDYDAIHDGLSAALAGCDIDLPNGSFMNQQNLSPWIPNPLTVADLYLKVKHILTSAISYGFLDRQQLDTSIPLDDPFSEQATLDVAREGLILLQNKGNLLPLNKNTVTKIAVIGNLAEYAPPTGFGSSYVTPIEYVSELAGIKSEVGANTQVDFISVCSLDPANTTWQYSNNGEITQGLQASYYTSNDLSGTPVVTRVDNEVNFDWDIDPIPVSTNQGGFSAKWVGQIVVPTSGDYVFKVRGDGGLRFIINGSAIFDNFNSPTTPPVGYGPTPAYSAKATLTAGKTYTIEIDYRRVGGFFDTFEEGGLTGIQASYAALNPPSTIAGYNAVIIAAGISNEYEGEGEDRSFTLPEFQDELIKNVSAANPQTVVVFHGGGNFDSQQWINQVAGLVEAFYPGQLGGQALAEILFGDVNPSGKLPITMEKRAQDNPAYATFPNPVNQHPDSLNYSEGVFIGYRGYDHNGIQPLFPFGFGLSYTTFSFSNLSISPASYDGTQPVTVTFTVTNTGNVAGAEVAQLYVGEKKPPLPRPLRELKGFQKVSLQPGQSQQVTLQLNQRSFAYWNINKEKWDAPQDTYEVWVGSSSQLSDLTLKGKVSLLKDITSNP